MTNALVGGIDNLNFSLEPGQYVSVQVDVRKQNARENDNLARNCQQVEPTC